MPIPNEEIESDLNEMPAEETGEYVVNLFAARFGVSQRRAMEMLGFADEHLAETGGMFGDDDLHKLNSIQRKAYQILIAYQQNQITVKEMVMSTRAMALCLGYYTAAGAETPGELARKLKVSKQSIGKCINSFIARLGLPILPGQRDESSRQKMSVKRKQQLESHE